MRKIELPAAARAAATALSVGWRRAWIAILGGALTLDVAAMHELGPWRLLVAAASVLFVVEVQAVCYRAVPRPGATPRPKIAARSDALRLLGVLALQAILLLTLLALGLVIVGAVAFGVASAGPGFSAADPNTWPAAMAGPGKTIVAGAGLAVLAGLAWVKVRLGLSGAATVDRGKVQVLSAWPLTKGAVLPVFAAMLAAAAPSWAVIAALHWVATDSSQEWLFLNLTRLLAILGVTLPLNAGFMAYLYGRLADSSPAPES